MGRTLMYMAIGGLLLLVLSTVFVIDHGGGHIPVGGAIDSSAQPETVSLHDLTTAAGIEQYRGRNVSTAGTLFFNSATNHHVITVADANYTVIVEWPGGLGQFEGRDVIVTGTFNVRPGEGPSIEATDVQRTEITPTPKDI